MVEQKNIEDVNNLFNKGNEVDINNYLQKILNNNKIEEFTINDLPNIFEMLNTEKINNTPEFVASIVRKFYTKNDLNFELNYENNPNINIDIITDNINKYVKYKADMESFNYHFAKIMRETIFNYYVSFIAEIDSGNKVIDKKNGEEFYIINYGDIKLRQLDPLDKIEIIKDDNIIQSILTSSILQSVSKTNLIEKKKPTYDKNEIYIKLNNIDQKYRTGDMIKYIQANSRLFLEFTSKPENKEFSAVIGSIVGNNFSSKYDDKGNLKKVTAGVIEKIPTFYQMIDHWKGVLKKTGLDNFNGYLPVYRWVRLSETPEDILTHHLPISTSFDYNFSINWGKGSKCCLFVILIRPEDGIMLSNPYDPEGGYRNQDQQEVTLPPSVLIIRQKYVWSGSNVNICQYRIIREEVIKKLFKEEIPIEGSDYAKEYMNKLDQDIIDDIDNNTDKVLYRQR